MASVVIGKIEQASDELQELPDDFSLADLMEQIDRHMEGQPLGIEGLHYLKNAWTKVKGYIKQRPPSAECDLNGIGKWIGSLDVKDNYAIPSGLREGTLKDIEAYAGAVQTVQPGGGMMREMLMEELGGELGTLVLQTMTRLQRYVIATDGDQSLQRAQIIRSLSARMYKQLHGLRRNDVKETARIKSISRWLFTRVGDPGSGAAYHDIDDIEHATKNLFSVAAGETETPLSSLAGLDGMD